MAVYLYTLNEHIDVGFDLFSFSADLVKMKLIISNPTGLPSPFTVVTLSIWTLLLSLPTLGV